MLAFSFQAVFMPVLLLISMCQLERVQQLTGPHFSAIVLDQSAVGHAAAKGPGRC